MPTELNLGMNAEPLIVPRASFVLKIPPAKVMTTREELELTRLAVARSPGSNTLRYRLASLLMLADNFDEVISLVPAWNVREPRFLELLASAHLSRETPADDLEARRLLLSALENGADDFQTASVLAELAKAHTRLSAFDEARRCLLESLRKNPDQKNAFKRLIALDLQVGSPQNVLAKADEMVERGVTHSRVLASRVLAFAQLGLMEEAHRARGSMSFYGRLSWRLRLNGKHSTALIATWRLRFGAIQTSASTAMELHRTRPGGWMSRPSNVRVFFPGCKS